MNELAKGLGLKTELKLPESPEELVKNALEEKIRTNIEKIHKLAKALDDDNPHPHKSIESGDAFKTGGGKAVFMSRDHNEDPGKPGEDEHLDHWILSHPEHKERTHVYIHNMKSAAGGYHSTVSNVAPYTYEQLHEHKQEINADYDVSKDFESAKTEAHSASSKFTDHFKELYPNLMTNDDHEGAFNLSGKSEKPKANLKLVKAKIDDKLPPGKARNKARVDRERSNVDKLQRREWGGTGGNKERGDVPVRNRKPKSGETGNKWGFRDTHAGKKEEGDQAYPNPKKAFMATGGASDKRQMEEAKVDRKAAAYKERRSSLSVVKALTAGYGGAGAPGALTHGGAIQSEALDDGRGDKKDKKKKKGKGFKYMLCKSCGHEQVYMKHQVKCRDCNKHASLEDLYKLMVSE